MSTSARPGPGMSPALWAALAVGAITLVRIAALVWVNPPLFFDEAQYWTWSLAPDWGYFSKPPMIAWLIAASTALFGDGEAAIRLTAPLLHAVTAFFIYRATRTLAPAATAAWAAVAWTLLPAVTLGSAVISTDTPLLACWAAALWAVLRAVQTGGAEKRWIRWLYWLAAGIALGLALLSKYAAVYFLAAFAGWLATDRDARARAGWAGPLILLILAGALIAPNLAWNAAHGFVTFAHTGDNAAVDTYGLHPENMAAFLAAQIAVAGPVLMIALIAAVARSVRPWPTGARGLLLWLTLLPLTLVTIQSLLARAHANWAATAYVSGVMLAVLWMAGRSRAWLYAMAGLHVLLAGLFYGLEPVRQAWTISLPAKLDPLARQRGWDTAGHWAQSLAQAYPDAPLLFSRRQEMATIMYYGRPEALSAQIWDYDPGRVRNHYDLTGNVEAHKGGDMILIAYRDAPETIARHFERDRLLSLFRQPRPGTGPLELQAYLLEGYLGRNTTRAEDVDLPDAAPEDAEP